MKSTGIVRHVDDLGRVVLPKSLRITLGLQGGVPVEVFVDGDRIILKKYTQAVTFAVMLSGNQKSFTGAKSA